MSPLVQTRLVRTLLVSLLASSAYAQDVAPKRITAAEYVDLPLEHIYIPRGFDSNDNTQIIVRGTLPNVCYRAPRIIARRLEDRVFVKAFVQPPQAGAICAQMEIPFLEAVSLNRVDAGTYDVIGNPGTNQEITTSLSVGKASKETVDDHVYARVELVEKNVEAGEIVLRGYNPSDCFEFDRVEFVGNEASVVADKGLGTRSIVTDTYAVLPILKQVSDICPRKMMPFAIPVKVPAEIKKRSVLLHVRVMDGRSLNTIFGEETF